MIEYDFGSSDDETAVSEVDAEEVDVEEVENSSASEDDSSDNEDPSWTSKDGTRWEQTSFLSKSKVGRKRSVDIMRTRPGVTSFTTARVHNEVQAFKVCFDDCLISLIIKHTNQKGVEKHGKKWNTMERAEFDAFMGLLILASICKSNKEPIETLWDEMLGIPIFRATISSRRFKDILGNIRVDNKENRSTQDKSAGIKNFWDLWNLQQVLLFTPFENIIITFYNKNKGGIDTVDRRIASYSVKRATKNWRVAVVLNGIDLSLNNAFVLYDTILHDWSKSLKRRRLFLENLGKNLVADQMSQRERIPRRNLAAQFIANVREEVKPSAQVRTESSSKRRRCSFCPNTGRKYNTTCSLCGNYICKSHTTIMCPACKENN